MGEQAVNIMLRPATNADAADVQQIVFGALAEFGYAGDPDGYDTDLRDIEGNYAARGGLFTVACDDAGRVLGSVALFPQEPGVFEMRKMFLRAEARGQGLGRRLVQHALDEARARGARRIELQTGSRLLSAIALYRKFGFTPFTPAHLAARCDLGFALDLRENSNG